MTAQILIADDHALTRHSIKTLLEEHPGWQVCAEAEDGKEALLQTERFKPDVVVLDLAMPVMNGLSAAREIHKSLPTVPIVILTVYDFPRTEEEAKTAGVRAVVSKVVSKEDTRGLVKTIEALLTQVAA